MSRPPRTPARRAIFISYRRNDTEGEAGRLFDDLVEHFGNDSVFMDVTAIEAGRDFRKAIDESVATCGVLLAIIGNNWVDAKNEAGQRRLDDAADFVRLETASALKRDIPVIPVLVRGARMPRPDQLPDDLKDLAYRNGVELTHARWASDLQLLIKALEPYVGDFRSSTAAPPQAHAPDGQSDDRSSEEGATPGPGPATTRRPQTTRWLAVGGGLLVVLAAGGYAAYSLKGDSGKQTLEQQRRATEEEANKRRTEAERAELAQKKADLDKAAAQLAADKAAAEKAATDRAAAEKAAADKSAADRAEAERRRESAEATRKAAAEKAAADKAAADRVEAERRREAAEAARKAAAEKAVADKATADRAEAERRREEAEAARRAAAEKAEADRRREEAAGRTLMERVAADRAAAERRPFPVPPPTMRWLPYTVKIHSVSCTERGPGTYWVETTGFANGGSLSILRAGPLLPPRTVNEEKTRCTSWSGTVRSPSGTVERACQHREGEGGRISWKSWHAFEWRASEPPSTAVAAVYNEGKLMVEDRVTFRCTP